MNEARKKAKLDEILEKKEAFEVEEGVLTYMNGLSEEENKKKLVEDAKLAALVGKVSREIQDDVILESLKTLSIEEEQRKSVEKATMMEIDGEPLPKGSIVQSIHAQSEQERKKAQMEDLRKFMEKVQSAVEHATHILFLDATHRQVELEATTTLADMGPIKKEALKVAMLQPAIEEVLVEAEDDVIETNLRSTSIRPRPVFGANE